MLDEFEDELPPYVRYSAYLNEEDGRGQSTWSRRELEVALRGNLVQDPPRYWKRDDGALLMYANRAHSFVGEAESLKSWAALTVTLDFASKGSGVVYVDCEDTLEGFAARLNALGVSEKVAENIAYIRPDESLFDRVWDQKKGGWTLVDTPAARDFLAVGRAYQAELLVIDGVTEVMAMHGLDINQATDIAKYHAMLLRKWPGKITTLEIDHVAKGDFSATGTAVSRGAIGSQHKRAGIDGVAFLFTPVRKGGVGGVSSSRVQLLKDRGGLVRKEAFNQEGDIGQFVLEGIPGTEKVKWRMEPRGDVHSGLELAEMLLEAITESPRGNKTLAQDLGLPEGKVRMGCERLEQGGLIYRGEQQKWTAVDGAI